MKIDHIETLHLRFEYAEGFTYAGGSCTARLDTLVRVHTDTGAVGVGSVYTHPALAHIVIEQQLKPFLVGEDPTEVERLWETMYRLTRWYGRKGAAMSALGALDTAFWDLRGQAAGQPIWKLLGGHGQTCECPAYASALLWKSPDELAEEATRLIEKGYRRVKMRLGRGEELDRASVRAVRDAIGDDHDILVDGSMRYSLQTARELDEFLAGQGVYWFEEPFEPEDLDAFVALRGTARTRLAAGENEFGLHGFGELIRAGAVDVVQPDASRCGGLSEVRRVARLARESGLSVASHSWSDAVAIVANAHVIGTAANGLTVEVDETGNPLVEDLLVEPLAVTAGTIRLSDRPGLGIALDDDVLASHRLEDPFSIPAGVYSDMVFESSDP